MEVYGKDAFAFIIDEGGEISAPVFTQSNFLQDHKVDLLNYMVL